MGRLSDGNRPKAKLKDVSIRRILQLFKSYWGQLMVIIGLALLAAVIGLIPPLVMKEIIDTAIPEGHVKLLAVMAFLLILLPVLSGVLGVWQNHLNTKVTQGVIRDLGQSLFHNLQRQSMAFFTDARSGEIVQRITGDVQAVQSVVTSLVVSSITQIVIVVTTIGILFTLDWKLAIISVLILPLFVLPVKKVSKLRKALRIETQKVRSDITSQLNENFGISGALLTRIFGREKQQELEFTAMNQKVMDLELRLNLVGRWFGMATSTLGPLGTAIIYIYGGYSVIMGHMTLGSIVAFTAYLGRLYMPVGTLLNLHVEVATALGVFQRIFEYQDMVPDVMDVPGARPIGTVAGRVAYKQVSFAYRPGEQGGAKQGGKPGDQGWAGQSGKPGDQGGAGQSGKPGDQGGAGQKAKPSDQSGAGQKAKPVQYALRDVTFEAQPGEMVALVGPSGAGKSTLIGMIARLYDPTAGVVEVDGVDVRDVAMASLRAQIAYVTQESFLFHATIGDNLRFAREDATREEMEAACRQAYIHDFIVSLPEGYDTMVGERGHRLSGGERQRIAIARAILKRPRILILDEATSHLDSESESYVQAALEELMQGRTTLVIAHRLSTVLAADHILVIEAGSVVERGTHSELLALEGLYARLYSTQFAKAAEVEQERANFPR
ncbi:ABC transporter transmembrane domain-containing protein [Paenibacillus roseipurpureus]|uniref:ABC transporter transmembrane domain-containing protein n=1 Tax=Paenibacillus roseopurpureus TaxID=2918901 RepID=A0AA96LPZ1_9BACL|nr:ABC transporter transmembrane domain-containing protein [Paenibacillus sp. MBLB1832]WNR45177.1 ABC transporter transmembrane domain-containing protein [Paenibacillus sp. MBLB1832]